MRAYAAALKAQAEQGSIEAVEELGCLIRSGAPGMPAQPDVAQGLLLYAAESGEWSLPVLSTESLSSFHSAWECLYVAAHAFC